MPILPSIFQMPPKEEIKNNLSSMFKNKLGQNIQIKINEEKYVIAQKAMQKESDPSKKMEIYQ